MSPAVLLGIAAAGAAGALVRDRATATDPARRTAALNVAGAAALGAATVLLSGAALAVVGTGLLGATTTFSTWAVQAEQHPRTVRAVLVPLVLGVLAAAAGRWLAMLVP